MTTYFLSYARLDERTALRFADDLIAAGVSVWVDQYDIQPSQHWDKAVETAVRGCQGVIVILSPRSAASPNVADEVSVAMDGGKEIIPILIEPCTMPLRMTRMQYIDAVKDYDAAVRRCLAVIGARGPGAAPARPDLDLAPGLPPQVLGDAERRLTSFMGPIAAVMVRQAAAKASERKSFLDWISQPNAPGRVVTPRATRIPEAPPAPSLISTEELQAITGALVRHLGPIATHMISRERAGASSKRDLRQKLAARIAGEKDRAAFLRETEAI